MTHKNTPTHSSEAYRKQIAAGLRKVLSIIHQVSGHDNLLLHHVGKRQGGAVGVLLIDGVNDLRATSHSQHTTSHTATKPHHAICSRLPPSYDASSPLLSLHHTMQHHTENAAAA
jgi:hypothetical protein